VTLRHPPRAVRRAIEFIQANLAGDIRLADIAAAAGQSLFHFSRTFRATTGLTPYRYLTQARIERAKTLLRESDLPLVAIADEAGFSDQSHMSKIFKRLTGWTPKAFRAGYGGPEATRLQV
jgi:AraC family transcriptional regulator